MLFDKSKFMRWLACGSIVSYSMKACFLPFFLSTMYTRKHKTRTKKYYLTTYLGSCINICIHISIHLSVTNHHSLLIHSYLQYSNNTNQLTATITTLSQTSNKVNHSQNPMLLHIYNHISAYFLSFQFFAL